MLYQEVEEPRLDGEGSSRVQLTILDDESTLHSESDEEEFIRLKDQPRTYGKPKRKGERRSERGKRRECVQKMGGSCSSFSSLEVDLDTIESDSNADPSQARFLPIQSGKRNSLDFIPDLPYSTEPFARRTMSQPSLPCLSNLNTSSPNDKSIDSRERLRESRWSSDSSKLKKQTQALLIAEQCRGTEDCSNDSLLIPPQRPKKKHACAGVTSNRPSSPDFKIEAMSKTISSRSSWSAAAPTTSKKSGNDQRWGNVTSRDVLKSPARY